MLRASSQTHDEAVDLHAITNAALDSGVQHGGLLLAFAEAVVTGEPESMARARSALVMAMGAAAMVDAAGVASNFQRMVRIADATRIPLGEPFESATADLRAELGLDALQTLEG
jgi:hypothetical protein